MRYPALILSAICMAFTAGAAKAEKRVAFVVGNGTYKNVAPLPNPSVDAKAMAQRASQRRLRSGRGVQPHPRQDD